MSSERRAEAEFSLEWLEEAEEYWDDVRPSGRRWGYVGRKHDFQSFIIRMLPDDPVVALTRALPESVPCISLTQLKPEGWQPWWRRGLGNGLWFRVKFNVGSPYKGDFHVEYGLPYEKPNRELWDAVDSRTDWPDVPVSIDSRIEMTRQILINHLWAHLTRAYELYVDETDELTRKGRTDLTDAEYTISQSEERRDTILHSIGTASGQERDDLLTELSLLEDRMLELEEERLGQRSVQRQCRREALQHLRQSLSAIRVSLAIEAAAYWYFPGAYSAILPIPTSFTHCCFLK